jgi:hypothetical protein
MLTNGRQRLSKASSRPTKYLDRNALLLLIWAHSLAVRHCVVAVTVGAAPTIKPTATIPAIVVSARTHRSTVRTRCVSYLSIDIQHLCLLSVAQIIQQ